MKTYLEFKTHIRNFQDVLEITKVIEKMSAAHIHFLKKRVLVLEEYISFIKKILGRFLLFFEEREHFLLRKVKSQKRAVLIVTGEMRLVGGLWHKILDSFLEKKENYHQVWVIGTKGKEILREIGIKPSRFFEASLDIPEREEAEEINDFLFGEFKNEDLERIDILYPKFYSLTDFEPDFLTFLPFRFEFPSEEKKEPLGFPIFEPSKKRIFNFLIELYIRNFLYTILLETKLCELSARTLISEEAQTKIKELISQLIISFRERRKRILSQRQIESFLAHKIIKPR